MEQVRAHLLIVCLLVSIPLLSGFAIYYGFGIQSVELVAILLGTLIGIGVTFYLLHRTESVAVATHWTSLMVWLPVGLSGIYTGGITGPFIPWLLWIPLFTQMLVGPRMALGWGVAGGASIVGLYFAQLQGWLPASVIPEEAVIYTRVTSIAFLVVMVFITIALFDVLQKWLIHRLDEEREKLRLVLETAPNGIVSVDGRGQIENANLAAEKMFGKNAQQLDGVSVSKLIPSLNDKDQKTGQFDGVDEPKDTRHTGLRAEGQRFPLSVSTGSYRRADEDRSVMILRDDTELQEMRTQMMRLDRLSAVGTLASGVGHEINNPLSYIKGNLEYVERSIEEMDADSRGENRKGSVDLADILDAIGDSLHGLERIEAIVDQLRTFTRRDESEPALTSVDVEECLESTLNIVSSQIENRAMLKREINNAPPVLAVEAGLGQVFLNLILNAVQAIPQGEYEEHQIEVRVDDDGDWVTISISDTGVGISEEDLDRIFDPFFTTKEDEGGTGLGLPISQNIIAEMGGRIAVDSELGRGSTFRVSLPVAPMKLEVTSDERIPTAELPDFEVEKILVVDDDKRICIAFSRMLKRAFDVDIETNSRRALERLVGGEHFDVIIVDLMMPQLDGVELIESVEKERPDLDGRFILITGAAFTSEVCDFVDERGVRIMEKPFKQKRLFELIEEIVDQEEPAGIG